MSQRNLDLVEAVFTQLRESGSEAALARLLAEDVAYELLVIRMEPLCRSMHGRALVAGYLSLAAALYQVIAAEATTLIADGNRVIARGGELACLRQPSQVVKTEWIGVFEIEGGLLKKISMSIYSWMVLAAASRAQPNFFASSAGGRLRILQPTAKRTAHLPC